MPKYCIALRARTNSGMPFGSKPLNRLMVVSVIMMPAEFMPKSSPLWIRPGMPSMMMWLPFAGTISKMMFQRSPDVIAGPVVVRDHDPAVLGVAAGGDEGAAMVGRSRASTAVPVLLVVPLVVVRQLQPGVQGHDVPHVQLHAVRLQRLRRCPCSSSRYSCSTCGHSTVLRRLAEELPVLLLVVRHLCARSSLKLSRISGASRYPCWIADLGGRAFQVHLDPAVVLGAAREAFFRRGVGLRLAGDQRKRQAQQQAAATRRRFDASRYYSKERRDGRPHDHDTTQLRS